MMATHGSRKLVTQVPVSEELLALADPALLNSVNARLRQTHTQALARVRRRCWVLGTEQRQSNADMDYWLRGLVRLALITRLYFPRYKLNALRGIDNESIMR
jgi:hypothetical protein